MMPIPWGGKTVLILCGPSGAGKSTFTTTLQGNGRYVVITSADHYFSREGTYKFDAKELSAAHNYCLRKFCAAAAKEVPMLVVDNTNTTLLEMAPYYSVAIAHGYAVEIHSFGLATAPEELLARTQHGVPLPTLATQQRKARNLLDGRTLPPFWTYKLVNHQ